MSFTPPIATLASYVRYGLIKGIQAFSGRLYDLSNPGKIFLNVDPLRKAVGFLEKLGLGRDGYVLAALEDLHPYVAQALDHSRYIAFFRGNDSEASHIFDPRVLPWLRLQADNEIAPETLAAALTQEALREIAATVTMLHGEGVGDSSLLLGGCHLEGETASLPPPQVVDYQRLGLAETLRSALRGPARGSFQVEKVAKGLSQRTFEETLRLDLDSGTIVALLGVAGPLLLKNTEPAGDRHVYFEVEREEACQVTFTFEAVDTTGQPAKVRGTLEFSGLEQHQDVSGLRKHFDEWVRRFIREHHHCLLIDGTRKVTLEDANGAAYSIYYKPGAITTMEQYVQEWMAIMGLPTIPTIPSSCSRALWSKEIPGLRLDQYVGIPGGPQKAFYDLGRTIISAFLLGNLDLHRENFLLGENFGVALDFETAGEPLIRPDCYPRRYDRDQAYSDFSIHCEGTARMLFQTWPLHPDLYASLGQGIKEGIERAPHWGRSDPLSLSPLNLRLCLAATSEYGELTCSKLPIPHYAYSVTDEQMRGLILRKQQSLKEAVREITDMDTYLWKIFKEYVSRMV